MSRHLLDTSCLIAAVCTWHERHESTRKEIERRRLAGATPVLAAHSLAEAYSVLTRLPAPHRLRPEDALDLLEANWSRTQLVALGGADYRRVLRRCRDLGIAGGAVYDAVIAACARKAGVETVLTWDTSGFERFLEDGPAVKRPGGA
ncbi:MAG TPA: PIN domain-containing protein [Vicinamibacteria bacterium]|nr:PIN domain-containing protein [Vicinamibacteria bacterium]